MTDIVNILIEASVEKLANYLKIDTEVFLRRLVELPYSSTVNKNSIIKIKVGDLARVADKSYMFVYSIISRSGLLDKVYSLEENEKQISETLPKSSDGIEYTKSKLRKMKYREVQIVAKVYKIKTKQRKSKLIDQIIEKQNEKAKSSIS